MVISNHGKSFLMKQIIVFLFSLGAHFTFMGQNIAISKEPCTDEMAQNTKGRWVPHYDFATSVTKIQKQETYDRLNVLHDILLKMFPQPVGVDVRVNRGAGNSYFGATGKYRYTQDDRIDFDYLRIPDPWVGTLPHPEQEIIRLLKATTKASSFLSDSAVPA